MQNTTQFYIICPPSLEHACQKEIVSKWPLYFQDEIPPLKVEKGGIALTTSLENGLKLNQILKSATKILQRLDEFKVRDFPKLFHKIQKIAWEKYYIGQTVEFHATTKKSRLLHSDRISKTAEDAFTEYMKGKPIKKLFLNKSHEAPNFEVHLRINEDTCTVSLNTSGESLYKRTHNKWVGVAPIRENLAYIMLELALGNLKNKSGLTLIDPMAGSGTLIHEAINYNELSERKFLFNYYPSIIQKPLKLESINRHGPFENFIAIDQSKKMQEVLKENFKDLNIEIIKADIFKMEERLLFPNSVIVLNPPYGERIKLPSPANEYYPKLVRALADNFAPLSINLLTPKGIKLPNFHDYQYRPFPFFNGGLELIYHTFVLK